VRPLSSVVEKRKLEGTLGGLINVHCVHCGDMDLPGDDSKPGWGEQRYDALSLLCPDIAGSFG
jgi:hypothetical protein